tara:strand:+ start:1516 stop:1971 length:456 start_codon:yes stop_codon:yes gene_type:complete
MENPNQQTQGAYPIQAPGVPYIAPTGPAYIKDQKIDFGKDTGLGQEAMFTAGLWKGVTEQGMELAGKMYMADKKAKGAQKKFRLGEMRAAISRLEQEQEAIELMRDRGELGMYGSSEELDKRLMDIQKELMEAHSNLTTAMAEQRALGGEE